MSALNNNQVPSHFGAQVSGQNPNTDQNQHFNNSGAHGNNALNALPPSGTHAQQHNLHSLETPLNQDRGTTGHNFDGPRDFEQEARKLQSDLERTHPHIPQQPGTGQPNQFSQNQNQGQGNFPVSSHPAAHNTKGMGTGVSGLPGGAGAEPYATTSIGGNQDHPTVIPGSGMSIGGRQHNPAQTQNNPHSNLPVPGSVTDQSKDNHHRIDQSKAEQTTVDRDRAGRKRDEFEHGGHHDRTTGTTGATHGAGVGHNTTSHRDGQHRTGPLETMGVTGATGRGDTNAHGTTGTGTHRDGTAGHGAGFDSSNRHQTAGGGLTSTEGRKDGDLLAQDTRATNTGNAAHKPTSEPTGHTKPTMGDKLAGKAEKLQGKITGNPALVSKGEQREQGFGPKN
ncbi:hypothetical protein CVT24_004999 [Panaeolus cyanescens]|uniref:CsbD-like domain-containing protein n=1 Tax=Panaeolus cyanescens TaxID=181874 RepID=A0A409VEG4_9AGAR|nr:hypothetical protein CVT24_004999 [Panaeolus cyanescens]